MVKSAIVNINEIVDEEKNPTTCLSPLRYTHRCDECRVFQKMYRKEGSIESAVKELKCKPLFDEARLGLIRDQERLVKQLKEIEEKLKR